jgi:phosphoribosylanthranilate isomerase
VIVKICGIRRLADAIACADAGADMAGVNLVPGARRRVDLALGRAMAEHLGACRPIGVFRDAPFETVVAAAEALASELVQLHGDESPELCERLVAAGLAPWKALILDDLGAGRAADYAPHVAGFVIDGRDAGSGRTWNHAGLAPHLDEGLLQGRPVLLAGGLDPDNVAEAVRCSGAGGADVASGVERHRAMAADRVDAFVTAARGALSDAGGKP